MSRVLVLIKGLGRGGAEQLVAGSLRHFDLTKDEFEVAYALPWKDSLVAEIRECGVAVHSLGDARGGWVPELRRLTHARRYDLIHSHSPYPATVVRVIAPRTTRHVCTEHNVWERYRPATRWGNAATFSRNRRVLAVSDEVAASIRYPRALAFCRVPPIERLYHGIDVERLRSEAAADDVRAEFGIAEDAPVVGVVANLKAHKGHATLLDSAAIVLRELPSARFLLIGRGPLEKEVRRGIDDRGLAGSVTLVGFREDVPRLLGACDVFALASYQEGLPVSLLEAMALGIPPVVTAVGGCPEVVTDKVDGRLVPPRDPEALASGLLSLLGDPSERRRLGAAASQRAADFDLSRASRRIQEMYEEVLA